MNASVERADLDAAEELLDEDIVWEHNLGEGTPEEGVYRGRGDVLGLYRRLLEAWREIRVGTDEIRPIKPGTFEVRGTMRFVPFASDVEIGMHYVQQLEIQNGRAAHVRMRISSDPRVALG